MNFLNYRGQYAVITLEADKSVNFSRAFAEFAESQLPSRPHEALIKNSFEGGEIVGHVCRDATEIETREKPYIPRRIGTKTGT